MANWSELLEELFVLISRQVKLIEDFDALHRVCKSWRAAGSMKNFDKSWPKVPLLMLAEKEGSDVREFVSLYTGQIWKVIPLPEAKRRRCMESRGWLVTVAEDSGEMDLLHPFSRVRIPLPAQTTIEEYELYETEPISYFVARAVLSASPLQTSDYVVMVVHSGYRLLGFWRPGDKKWTTIQLSGFGSFCDVNYYNGKFYSITYSGDIWVCDVSGPNPTTASRVLHLDYLLLSGRQPYLVESCGELLLVTRDGIENLDETDSGEAIYGVSNFGIFKLDLVNKKYTEVKSLEERAIFVGQNSAFSVDTTSFAGVLKPNCIYFTDDSLQAFYFTKQGGGKDMGIYHLEDGRIERFYNNQSFSHISPPVWVAPSV